MNKPQDFTIDELRKLQEAVWAKITANRQANISDHNDQLLWNLKEKIDQYIIASDDHQIVLDCPQLSGPMTCYSNDGIHWTLKHYERVYGTAVWDNTFGLEDRDIKVQCHYHLIQRLMDQLEANIERRIEEKARREGRPARPPLNICLMSDKRA